MVDHGARDHAVWSASATSRNVQCPGALALTSDCPDNPSIHADTGTAVHQISERCLRSGGDAVDYLDTVEKTKKHDIPITDELVNSAQEYIDYCRALQNRATKVFIEERFSLNELGTPFDAGGTGDFTAYFASEKTLEIVDLKNGTGIVEAIGNPQMRTYGVGALLKHSDLDVEWVKTTIVQPRGFHREGTIRSEVIYVAALIEWTAELLDAMGRSKQAQDEFKAAGSNTVLLDEWRDKWLKPGKCTFCPVEGPCPALKKKALEVAAVFFEPETDQPQIGNSAMDMSPEALARDLDAIPMLEDWIEARRAYAHSQAENGVDIPGYQLADKIGNRKWLDEVGKDIEAALENAGFHLEQAYVEPKLKSPAQMEKLLGAKRKALIEPFVTREVTGTNLVASSKTSRPPAKTKPQTFFEPVETKE